MVGGFSDARGESREVLDKVVRLLAAAAEALGRDIVLRTLCVLDCNTRVVPPVRQGDDGRRPVVLGAAISPATGQLVPAVFADEGPDPALRCMRYFIAEGAFANLYDPDEDTFTIPVFKCPPCVRRRRRRWRKEGSRGRGRK